MRYFYLLAALLICSSTQAQLYYDASDALPDNGARGQSMDVKAVDLNGDESLDIVLANEFQPNTILWNNGSGQFSLAASPALAVQNHDSEDVVVADFNGDEALDLAFCSEDDVTLGIQNVHELYFGDGAGNFTTSTYNFPDTEANA
ncbi:MAG: VCBS repeat-containing protein, partial [Bacteroidota bacterium]